MKLPEADMTACFRARWTLSMVLVVFFLATQSAWPRSKNQNSDQLRAQYLSRVLAQTASTPAASTLGSLYNPSASVSRHELRL